MSWIRSDKAILHHPKTAHLQVLLKVDMDIVIGRLHRLWWWCLDYALDGDLTKQEGKVIEHACGIPLRTLIRSGFVDSRPYRRIHDWWDNQGAYLRSRYHKQPEIWQRIEKLYERGLDTSLDMSSNGPRISPVRRTDVTDVRTYGQKGRTDVDVKKRADSADAPSALPEIKSYEEAAENELCGPPKGMWEQVKKGMKHE